MHFHLCHDPRFACQQRVLKTFPDPGCPRSEDYDSRGELFVLPQFWPHFGNPGGTPELSLGGTSPGEEEPHGPKRDTQHDDDLINYA